MPVKRRDLRKGQRVAFADASPLLALSDGRAWRPSVTRLPDYSYPPAIDLLGSLSRPAFVPVPSPKPRRVRASGARFDPFSAVPLRIGFARPRQVVVCVRRHQRREVLFALRRTGKGSSSPRKRSLYSDVRC